MTQQYSFVISEILPNGYNIDKLSREIISNTNITILMNSITASQDGIFLILIFQAELPTTEYNTLLVIFQNHVVPPTPDRIFQSETNGGINIIAGTNGMKITSANQIELTAETGVSIKTNGEIDIGLTSSNIMIGNTNTFLTQRYNKNIFTQKNIRTIENVSSYSALLNDLINGIFIGNPSQNCDILLPSFSDIQSFVPQLEQYDAFDFSIINTSVPTGILGITTSYSYFLPNTIKGNREITATKSGNFRLVITDSQNGTYDVYRLN